MAKRTIQTTMTQEHRYIPFLTWRFDAALHFASGLHHEQRRKGGSIPYVAHLLGVCALVLEAGGDEDQAIAALLHDAVEDQGGISTLKTIHHLFGSRVAGIVKSCSDSTVSDPTKKPSWRHRKEKYLAHLQMADRDALLSFPQPTNSTMPERFCPTTGNWATTCGRGSTLQKESSQSLEYSLAVCCFGCCCFACL
jgi:(p)ppGpp synthase/HD superfamily hydrolase